jgi:hypothetical protein
MNTAIELTTYLQAKYNDDAITKYAVEYHVGKERFTMAIWCKPSEIITHCENLGITLNQPYSK